MINRQISHIEQKSEAPHIRRNSEILDRLPSHKFDHFLNLTAQIFNVPMAVIALVGKDRIWFSVTEGVQLRQFGNDGGLFAETISSPDMYVIEDAAADPKTLSNPLVTGGFHLRFYAAAPLKVKGSSSLGAICIIDRKPRLISPHEKQILVSLSKLITAQLEFHGMTEQVENRQNQLSSLLAHELKNSLTPISPYAQLIKSEAGKNPHIIQMSENILRAVERMKKIINDMLDVAQINSDKVVLKRKEIDVALLVEQILAQNAVLAEAKQQQILLDIGGRSSIIADEIKIIEIIDNLINNGIKYSPFGATILTRVMVQRGTLIIEVIDEGPGLSPKDQEYLFMPFSKLSAKPTGGECSTGIGLSIVKLLAEAHGGKVYAQNNPEKQGAIFRVELPTRPFN